MFDLKAFRSLALLSLGCVFLLSTHVEARSCYYYVDAFGRTRERCRGILGGGIAGIIVGSILGLLILLGIAQLIRRRRQRPSTLPVANAGYYGPAPTMGQPPNYPPPNFPPPAQQPYQTGYQGEPVNQYQPPPGPPPGEKYDGNPHGGVQMPTPAANHS